MLTKIEILGVPVDADGRSRPVAELQIDGAVSYRTNSKETVIGLPPASVVAFSAILAALNGAPITDELYLSLMSKEGDGIRVNGQAVGAYVDDLSMDKMRVVRKRG